MGLAPDDPGDVVCDIVADHLQCTYLQSQITVSIPVDHLICVLPDPEQSRCRYKLLFLQRRSESQEVCTFLESIRVTYIPSTILSVYLFRDIPPHFQGRNVHVVISTASGTGKGKNVFHNVLQPFLSHLKLDNYKLHETQSPNTISELANSTFLPCARTGIPQTIVLFSGDGGLVDIVNAFHTSTDMVLAPPNIALIPTGTGNAMASSIGLLRHPNSTLVALLQGKPVLLPTFVANFSPGAQQVISEGQNVSALNNKFATGSQSPVVYGAVVASWGLHATLVADSDTAEYRKFGNERFKMAAKELLYPSNGSETHRYNGVIDLVKWDELEKKQYVETMKHTEHMYMLATLVSRLEKDFVISPNSLPLDGRLKLVHFAPMPPEEVTELLGLAYQSGQHAYEAPVTYEDIEGFRITFQEENEKWRRVCVDGRIITVEENGWMEVRKETRSLLNVITCATENDLHS
ncbi:Diacylglycerol kinase catalytic domain protein [Aspergillus sclerotialis]|uniref:Diacylglycerol kinase catalytic domain protein n=1 Tax=Aspergillus sclerotialis TaxID=2070753 RepID=A0A3A2ZAM4_9EURO|nr:Diacylglycerol kinase catalytic domain protein [Aspergillus sclerotialis]